MSGGDAFDAVREREGNLGNPVFARQHNTLTEFGVNDLFALLQLRHRGVQDAFLNRLGLKEICGDLLLLFEYRAFVLDPLGIDFIDEPA